MARYTREQRRRAVGLYVRYECCAADVIRELGYPSREALRMWHHDWLEERKTGVPSTSGERYACYTTEQKRAAVDHYLTHGRRASRTIRRSGHPGREALAVWLDGLAPGERRLRHGPVSEELEREAVPRVASGGMTSRRTRRSRAWIRRSCGTGGGNRPARRKGPWWRRANRNARMPLRRRIRMCRATRSPR